MLLITGPANSGKDTAAEYLQNAYGITYQGSSAKALEIFLLDRLESHYGYRYDLPLPEGEPEMDQYSLPRLKIARALAHKDKYPGIRQIWYREICKFNQDDPARLAREILADCYCYCGMRSKREIDECKNQGLFAITLYIDRPGYQESAKSMDIKPEDCDLYLYNGGDLDDLYKALDPLGQFLKSMLTLKAIWPAKLGPVSPGSELNPDSVLDFWSKQKPWP